LASAAFITIRSRDRGRKAILRVTATIGAIAAFALEMRGFEEVLRARDGRA
jgi:hypothetical protein